jgi:hypothetical protein
MPVDRAASASDGVERAIGHHHLSKGVAHFEVMKLFVIVAAAIALAGAAVAHADTQVPAGFYNSIRLAPAAAFVAGKAVTVECAKTAADWQQQGGRVDSYGLTFPGTNVVKLAPDVCRFLRARVVNPDGFGASLLVLVHEAIHARGSVDEGVTDCAAVHEMPRVAVKFFGVKAGKQLRAIMANAWNFRDRSPAQYRTVC